MSSNAYPVKWSIRVRIHPANTGVFLAGVRIVVDFYCREKRQAVIYVCIRRPVRIAIASRIFKGR